MRTICVIVDMFEAYSDILYITENFPCFVNSAKFDNTYAEVSITCREEDAKAIESRLAWLV